MDRNQLNHHIKTEHAISPLTTYIKEFVYGGNDGIVTTFAVVAGFSGANLGDQALNISIISVLLFGLANLFADGAAMGLGNYLSIRSEKKLYKNFYKKELEEIKNSRDHEIEETELLYREQGFSDDDAKKLTQIISRNTDYWARFMVKYECEMDSPEGESEVLNGLATFASFVVFGFIPIIPYLFMSNVSSAFIFSTICTAGALILLGMFRAYATKDSYVVSIIETLIIGGTAASLAYFVGFLFKN